MPVIILRKLLVLLVLFVVLIVMAVGCTYGVPAERVHALNNEWYRLYNSDRRLTEAETAMYATLTDEQKAVWSADGKPVPAPLSERMLDAAKDHYNTTKMEAAAAE
jgi:hypothetical protein